MIGTSSLVVRYARGERFLIHVRGHDLIVDQPLAAGGDDLGPTPTELFVAGLASCIGFYAARALRRHNVPADGLRVECGFEMSEDRPARVGSINVNVVVPAGLSEARRKALLAVAEHCTVHNTLRQPPEVSVELSTDELAA